MKVVMYRVKGRNDKKGLISSIYLEKILFLSFVVVFLILVFAQVLLISPSVGTFAGQKNTPEGRMLGDEEYLYRQGKITIELLNKKADENIKVLLNGDEVSTFESNSVSLDVKNGDVIEIDGSTVQEPVEVAIIRKSDNISQECISSGITVDSEIKLLAHIRLVDE